MILSSLGTVVYEAENHLVSESLLSTTSNAFGFYGLDGLTDGGYHLDVSFDNIVAGTALYMSFNADYTNTNYTANTNNGTAVNSQTLATNIPLNARLMASIDITIANGRVRANGIITSWSGNTALSSYTFGLEYLVSVSNLTSILFHSSAANSMSAGCVARLYRKKRGVPSAVPSIAGMLVADILVSAPVTQLDITGLDINLHGGYIVNASIIMPNTGPTLYYEYINGQTSATAYYSENLYANGASVTAARYNSPNIAGNASPAGSAITLNGQVTLDATGYTNSFYTGNYARGGNLDINIYMKQYSNSVTNVNSISYASSIAGNIGAGSRFRLYRRK